MNGTENVVKLKLLCLFLCSRKIEAYISVYSYDVVLLSISVHNLENFITI